MLMLGYPLPFLFIVLVFEIAWYLTIHPTTLPPHISPLSVCEDVPVWGDVSGAQCMFNIYGRLCPLSLHREKLRLSEFNHFAQY